MKLPAHRFCADINAGGDLELYSYHKDRLHGQVIDFRHLCQWDSKYLNSNSKRCGPVLLSMQCTSIFVFVPIWEHLSDNPNKIKGSEPETWTGWVGQSFLDVHADRTFFFWLQTHPHVAFTFTMKRNVTLDNFKTSTLVIQYTKEALTASDWTCKLLNDKLCLNLIAFVIDYNNILIIFFVEVLVYYKQDKLQQIKAHKS